MRRAIIALIVGVIVGYWIGYEDAYRGEKAIGSRIRIAMGRVNPDGVRTERQRRADALRDSIRSKSGIDSVVNLP
jgi:hypothetical protein